MANGERPGNYDDTPYLARSYPQSSPDHLATIAHLLGLAVPDVATCRVLELGCASGGNIIPLAESFPGSTFVGVDASARQIAQGRAAIGELGLNNVVLRQASILDVDRSWGTFDYVIAHGVYSWVPEAVREHILAICGTTLAADGIAYVSYNTRPGWRTLGAIRDALLFHTRGIATTHERASAAMAMLDFLSEQRPGQPEAPAASIATAAGLVKSRLAALGSERDTYLFHELLEEVNEPIYFVDFVGRAARHGLQYLADARIREMPARCFSELPASPVESAAASVVDAGQYLDFLRDQTFRQTLLCRRGRPVDHSFRPSAVRGLYAASRALPDGEAAGQDDAPPYRYRGLDGAAWETAHPLTHAAMVCLLDLWPRSVPGEALLSRAYAALDLPPGEQDMARDLEVLAEDLFAAYRASPELVNVHMHPFQASGDPGLRPYARPYARWQARRQDKLTNVYHELVALDELSRRLLPWLDGSHDRPWLLASLREDVQQHEGLRDPDGEMLGDQLDEALAFLAYAGVLVEPRGG